MSGPTNEDIGKSLCEPEKQHKCLPSGMCYGSFYYCSPDSGSPEPCVKESILSNNETLSQLCGEIIDGKSTDAARHPLCNLKGDCFTQFGPKVQEQIQAGGADWLHILLGIISGLLLLVVVVGLVVCFYRRRVRTKRLAGNEEHELTGVRHNGHDLEPPVSIIPERERNTVDETQQAAESRGNEAGDNPEVQPLLRNQRDHTENVSNMQWDHVILPHSSSDTHGGSQRSDSSANSSDTGGDEHQRQNHDGTLPNGTHYNRNGTVHPAELENAMQRAWHMATVEPCDKTQHVLVTSLTKCDTSNALRE